MEKDKTGAAATGAQVSTNVEQSMSERFMTKVMAEFGSGVGPLALTDFQKRLAQNYFIVIDANLKVAEEKRISSNKTKSQQYQNTLPMTWANVNMELLARSVVSLARVGLDPAQKNHVNMIPFKNNTTQKYDLAAVLGYRGIELQAKKYGLDIPDSVIVELVYSNDKFKSYKKDKNNPIETYEFEIVNDFDRGELVGGFYYHLFAKQPEKNKLVVFTMKDIEKRKPKYASVEFWGGEKDVYENGKKTGEKEKVDGWFDDMCRKTIARAAYGNITIDSQKIDDDYMTLKQAETAALEAEVEAEIRVNANGDTIDIEAAPVADAGDQKGGNVVDMPAGNGQQNLDLKPTGTGGPGF